MYGSVSLIQAFKAFSHCFFIIMNIYEQLTNPKAWENFLDYKRDNRHLSKAEEKDLTEYIEGKEYLEAVSKLMRSDSLIIPEKKLIRKMDTDKKRVVYIYPREINNVLKLMTFLLLRKYDDIFSDTLYSFRAGSGVSRALYRILGTTELESMYSYKVDISNYFNSIPVEKMLIKLREVLRDEPEICGILERLLSDDRIVDGGNIVRENKGVMAGTPFAVFLANVYLMDMDKEMERKKLIYARYSDDIIVFAADEAGRNEAEQFIGDTLHRQGLSVNEKKEIRTSPGENWSFLGIGYSGGRIDISEVSREKIKAKIRRRARAIKRWQVRKGIDNEKAVKAFIKAINKKFFDADSSHEQTWARWYFPVINTDETLREIDRYVQHWIRFLATDRHNKKSFEFTYEDMKKMGYVSLVHEWYEGRN